MQTEDSVPESFIVRVYGFLMNSMQEILIAHEYHYDRPMVKFPGGGLQFGEGPYDTIRRELIEELEFEIDGGVQFHTTDFFSRSAFNHYHQVLGIYYLIETDMRLEKKFRSPIVQPTVNGELGFRWVGTEELKTLELTFPTDRQALEKFLLAVEQGLIRWPEKA